MRRDGANAVIEAYENGYERKALVVMATGAASRAPYNELAPSGPDVLFEDDRVIKNRSGSSARSKTAHASVSRSALTAAVTPAIFKA
jgi:hypothetical protein